MRVAARKEHRTPANCRQKMAEERCMEGEFLCFCNHSYLFEMSGVWSHSFESPIERRVVRVLWPCRAGAKRLSIPASVKDADALPFHLLEKQPAEHQTATQWRWLLEMTRTQWSLPVTLNASPPQVVNIRTHTHNIYIYIYVYFMYIYMYNEQY